MSETLKRRELKSIAERVNNSGVEKALKHKDFKFIFDYMNQNSVSKIIFNTTLTSPEISTMKYMFDEDKLVISSAFENSNVDNANIMITKDKVIVSFLDNKIIEYNETRGTKRILLNYINQLKQLDKVFKKIDNEVKKDNKENKILEKHGMEIK